jgi:medium-chain acyl-[acyl-carrier-protein] hydrolase
MKAPAPWFVCARPNPAATRRLLCFPYAGGNSTVFHAWGPALPPWLEVWALELPGRGRRFHEAPVSELDPLIDRFAPLVIAAAGDRPYALFGHSFGGLVAFELAHRLRDAGVAGPTRLFVGACPAPHLPRIRPAIHDLPDAQFLAEVKALSGTPDEVLAHPELIAMVLPMLRADFKMVETYRHRDVPALDCPIIAFCGRDDTQVSADRMLAWAPHTRAGFQLELCAGDHFFLDQQRSAVLARVATELQGR